MEVCCYIISCEKTGRAAIVDPGGNEEEILAACHDNRLSIEYIIATHCHPDHVCANRPIKEASGAKIIMHNAESEFFSQPKVRNYFSMLGLESSPPADILVEDGDSIDFGEVSLQVIHTPGHTPGGICLYAPGNCFSGDTLFVGAVGRTDFPGGSTSQLQNSIREKLMTLPADTVVWPGHGYGGLKSTIGREAKTNPCF